MEKKCAQNQYHQYPKHAHKSPLVKIHGEAIVSGKSHIDIHCRKIPVLAFAWFGDNAPNVGCGNHRHDSLDVYIMKKRSRWVVRIFWDIQSGCARQIHWEAFLMKGRFYALLAWLFR